MIITYKPFGRLGNRLFLFAHLIAFADRYKSSLINYAFREYKRNFPFWGNGSGSAYAGSEYRNSRVFSSYSFVRLASAAHAIPVVRFWDDREIIFDGADSSDPRIQRLIVSPIVIFEGWNFRSREQITLSRETILSAFKPRADILHTVGNRIAESRERGEITLGVHVRWQDYIGTDRYFSLKEYLEQIRSVQRSLSGKKVTAVITSSEKITQEDLPSDCVVFNGKDAVADMYTLASCEYILGPPSTFSAWASYYGGKPLIVMRNHHDRFGVENAEIVRW